MDNSLVARRATLIKKSFSLTHSLTLLLRLENDGIMSIIVVNCFQLHGEIDSPQSVFYTDR